MIFFTGYYGGTHGTAKSAQDFLKALCVHRKDVLLISPEIPALSNELINNKVNMPRHLNLERLLRKKARFNIFRNIKKWLLLNSIPVKETVIVNGWASIDKWNLLKHKFKGKKAIIIRESLRHFKSDDFSISEKQLINAFREFDFLIFVSENSMNEWTKYPELSGKPSFFIPNCCEEEEVERALKRDTLDARQSLGLNPDEFIVICPGSIEQRKGHDLLINILPDLAQQISNLRILFLGSAYGKWGKFFLKQLESNNHSNLITHIEAKPSAIDYLSVSDVLAFPSRAEAMPRTILEAMALKLPVVASSVDGIPELVLDSQTGSLFKSDDAQGLLEGLLRMYNNPDLRNQYSESGQKRYWNYFSREHQIDRMKQLLAKLEGLI